MTISEIIRANYEMGFETAAQVHLCALFYQFCSPKAHSSILIFHKAEMVLIWMASATKTNSLFTEPFCITTRQGVLHAS